METSELILLFKYVVLGLVQGFTEPIPVSSSGHVIIANHLLGLDESGLTFAILTNTASLLAICFIYRKDLVRLIVNCLLYVQTKNGKYKSDFLFIIYIIIGTIPAAVLGVLFNEVISDLLTNIKTIAFTLFVTGIALWVIRNFRGVKRDKDIGVKDAFIVGLAQAIALVPGISRSGATVIASVALGMKQETALRYSFMLYIPISLGGLVLGISDLMNEPVESTLVLPYIMSFIVTIIMTYIAMKWFMGIMRDGNLKYFAYYCFAASIILLILS
ncbi:undecaprenyl-diphosphate phosphatase [Psychrobacillus sp. FSL H8-0484]|uniref:undecaprenyl-diphosphate phosphatase n=1 Tax=Psychrobacillus sp. FSL H8-0484 TaxID=2921390 RepID=UPI0030F60D19